MSADHHLLHAAEKLVHAMNKKLDESVPTEIAEIVKFHSTGAAAAGVASGWVPGFGGAMAATISAGFIWTMYGRINAKIELPFSDNVVKSIASGVATNLAAYVAGMLVVSTVLSVLPGLGSIGAAGLVGVTCYAMTLASGYVYLKMLTKLFLSGRDPTTMDTDSLKQEAASAASEDDIKTVIQDAKKGYKPKTGK